MADEKWQAFLERIRRNIMRPNPLFDLIVRARLRDEREISRWEDDGGYAR